MSVAERSALGAAIVEPLASPSFADLPENDSTTSPAISTPSLAIGTAIEPLSDLGAIAALRPEWEEVLSSSISRSFFLTWEWLYTWIECLGARRRTELLALRRGRRLIALAPFVRSKRARALRDGSLARSLEGLLFPRSLGFLGDDRAGSDYLDLIVRAGEEPAAADAFAGYLQRQRMLLELRRVPAEGSLIAGVCEQLLQSGWTLQRKPSEICPVLDVADTDWDGFLGRLGTSHRQNVRRRLRKLEQTFAVELQQVQHEVEVDAALDVLFDLHHARWDGRGGSDAFDPRLEEFHRRLARRALARGWLRLFVLRLDGSPVAALYGFRYDHRFLYYQSGFDPAHASHSVGLAILALSIRAAIGEGVREYDLLHGAESYKFHWATGSRELQHFELYPPSRYAVRRRLRGLARRARELAALDSELVPDASARRAPDRQPRKDR